MIDLVLGDKEVRERVKRLRMEDKMESDHQPVKVWIGGGWRKKEGRKEFEEKLGRMEKGRDLEERRKEVEKRILKKNFSVGGG